MWGADVKSDVCPAQQALLAGPLDAGAGHDLQLRVALEAQEVGAQPGPRVVVALIGGGAEPGHEEVPGGLEVRDVQGGMVDAGHAMAPSSGLPKSRVPVTVSPSVDRTAQILFQKFLMSPECVIK